MKALNYFDKKNGKALYSPIGWYMTEKFDGQRAQWCPESKSLISRYGNVINAPSWFIEQLSFFNLPLDGELFMGYNSWHMTGIFRAKSFKSNNDLWRKARFMVFDIPDIDIGDYVDRMKVLDSIFQTFKAVTHNSTQYILPVNRILIKTKTQLNDFYQDILSRGGEGAMINSPTGFYCDGRTSHILKLKPVMDDECIIVGYKEGNGRNVGKLGSFIVHPIEDGVPNPKKEFGISGVSDLIRSSYKKTHPIGTVLSYACSDYTEKSGKPRHPRYLGKCKKHVLSVSLDIDNKSGKIKARIKPLNKDPLCQVPPISQTLLTSQSKIINKGKIKARLKVKVKVK